MMPRRIVTLLAPTALMVLAAGCAAQRTSAGSSPSDPAAIASEFTGTSRGSFWLAGLHGSGGSALEGDVTLEIRDDATYTMTWTRRASQSNTIRESGIAVPSGRGVALKSSRANSLPLMGNGDTLYGLTTHATGYTVKVSVERVR
jgi:hypothetical protein